MMDMALAPRKPAVRPLMRPPVGNRLLAALPGKDLRRFLAGCERLALGFGEVLFEPAARIRHVYFPTEGFISLVSPLDSGESLEVGLVGNEGMLGVPLVLNVDVSPLRALVQGSGAALRMSAAAFRHELDVSLSLRRELSRYAYVLLVQLAQMAACSRFHELDSRLARWLLMSHDRAHSDAFHLTQELLARMLGVRRVSVTNAAGLLQRQKLVRYSRGNITILDRAGLEAISCSCYQREKATYQRILGYPDLQA